MRLFDRTQISLSAAKANDRVTAFGPAKCVRPIGGSNPFVGRRLLRVERPETGVASSNTGRSLAIIAPFGELQSEKQKPLSYDMDRPVGERKVEVGYADLSSCRYLRFAAIGSVARFVRSLSVRASPEYSGLWKV